MPCARCESLPSTDREAGSLHLWLPVGHSRTKVAAYLRETGRTFTHAEAGGLVVPIGEQRAAELLLPLAGLLSQVETEDTRCLFKAGSGALSAADIPHVQSLRQFLQLSQASWLVEMLREERLTSHFQPIVEVADPQRVLGHEILLRGVSVDGSLVSPGHLFEVARECNLLFQLDLAARRTAIETAIAHSATGRLFLNFSPTAIYDPSHCLLSTISAIDEVGISHDRVVFEVIEADKTVDVFHLRGILNYYRSAGFQVALDDIGSGYSSLNLLHQLRPDFVKLDIELIRGVDRDPYKALIAEKILEIAQRLGIATIAEGVERPEEFAWVKASGATYAQGYLFGRPAVQPLPAGVPAH
jgi:EAL domain-containing protein (putative c-di-GMP-specific phosphodiesterase class I)